MRGMRIIGSQLLIKLVNGLFNYRINLVIKGYKSVYLFIFVVNLVYRCFFLGNFYDLLNVNQNNCVLIRRSFYFVFLGSFSRFQVGACLQFFRFVGYFFLIVFSRFINIIYYNFVYICIIFFIRRFLNIRFGLLFFYFLEVFCIEFKVEKKFKNIC